MSDIQIGKIEHLSDKPLTTADFGRAGVAMEADAHRATLAKLEQAQQECLTLQQENEKLRTDLKEALDEWEYSSVYKGEYLQKKHRDLEEIEAVRERHGLTGREET